MFDYFYGNEPKQFAFYIIPQVLFTDERFKSLSCEAKVLYGIMLNRAGLSAKNGWQDENGRVYISFKREEVCENLGCKKDKATKILNELDVGSGIGLIKKINQGQGKPAIIYVLNFASVIDEMGNKIAFKKAEKSPSEKDKCTTKSGKILTYAKSSFENKVQKAEIPPSRGRKNRPLESDFSDPYIISKKNRVIFNNQSHHSDVNDEIELQKNICADDRKWYEEEIKINIDYEWWLEIFNSNSINKPNGSIEELNEILNVMVDVVCSDQQEIRVGRQSIPHEVVKSRFLNIQQKDIEYLFDCFAANHTKIRNMKSYIITSLYNAAITSNITQSAEYRHECQDLI